MFAKSQTDTLFIPGCLFWLHGIAMLGSVSSLSIIHPPDHGTFLTEAIVYGNQKNIRLRFCFYTCSNQLNRMSNTG